MKLITNSNPFENHLVKFTEFAKASDEIILMSPFLAHDLSTILKKEIIKKTKKLTIITCFNSNAYELSQKINFLFTLKKFCSSKDNFFIKIDNKLHGKVYLFKKSGKFISGMVTSANLTLNGLNFNSEWGIIVNNQKFLSQIEKSILFNKNLINLTSQKLLVIKKEVENYLNHNPLPPKPNNDIDIKKFFSSRTNEEINYWLKPIGVTYDPITEDRIFNQKKLDLYFSKVKPSGVKIGDIIITYGVGVTKILSYYKVTSEPKHLSEKILKAAPQRERWPWFVWGDNLSVKYGEIWASKNLTLHNLVSEFQSIDITNVLTKVGGKTLGAFNRGLDKIKIRNEFAEYLIGKIEQNSK